MSAYTDRIDAARNTSGNLFRQVMYAIWSAANDVVNEDPATAKHNKRLDWASKIRSGGVDAAEAHARRIMPQVLMNSTVQAAPESAGDDVVQAVVNGLINNWI